jgi:hypothetical protein
MNTVATSVTFLASKRPRVNGNSVARSGDVTAPIYENITNFIGGPWNSSLSAAVMRG